MPYGISDAVWGQLSPEIQTHAQTRVENARAGRGQYGSVEAAKAANLAQWGFSMFGGNTSGIPGVGPRAMTGLPEADVSAADQSDGGDSGGGGGGSDGGGGGGGYVRPTLASSPEWLAYLNSLGLEENQFRADIDRQRGLAQSAADAQIGMLGNQYQQQRQGISGSLSARGMSQSGEYLRRIAQNQANQGQAVAGVQTGLAGQIGGLESQLANRLIDLGSRRAERELQLRTSGYQ